ncbi:4-hydroxy-tetrahydrodipicolinate synthase [Algoriphagus sediminis]|uniref:4-hydroxy-tetrahydrodipicolinate synthase n=1 Tax=Algoriphagus sediminis TaxID=3057113 RepID=A0ABT7Y8G6_9BACT|nr:4-hydroxy-tetrahydrodipicolinate synthase [Algoriphagus sediminis]MDN3202787.1 4-hydroxy-tetrahydrodipicolinate synthase [Algoriphagus sediminis]
MKKLQGTGVALVTPFNDDLSIDFEGLKRLIQHASNGGADYLVVMGTTGEAPTLSRSEKAEVLAKAKEFNEKNLPIVYGIGGNSTQAVIDEIQETNLQGVDAILSVSPYYNKPTQAGIKAHFEKIADHSPLPIIVYNIPGRTMSNMEAETTLALAKHPKIIGMKEASGKLDQCREIALRKPDDFLLISGDDALTVAILELGGDGIISVLANAIPGAFKKMCHGSDLEAEQGLSEVEKFNDLMYLESNPVGIKNLLKHKGICGDQVRLPLLRASEELDKKIKAQL